MYNSKTSIPALSLKDLVDQDLLMGYRQLFASPENWINCEKNFKEVDDFTLRHWQERLYLERLEEKSILILDLLEKSGNNWEAVLFQMLAKNFGLNLNGDAFLSMAQSLDFSVVQKSSQNNLQLEALFIGQAGLLSKQLNIPYYKKLQQEYAYLKHKYRLSNSGVIPPKYFRLRPDNFPNIRLSQLASLYFKQKNLFSELIASKSLEPIYKILDVETSEFWREHYSFPKKHREREKRLSSAFKDLVLINTIVPLRFCYSQSRGNDEIEILLELIEKITAENNKIIQNFNKIKNGSTQNALHSQAMVHLKKNYCEANKCLDCAIGVKLLQRKT